MTKAARFSIMATAAVITVFLGWIAIHTVIDDFNKWDFVYEKCDEGSECALFAKLFVNDYSETKDLAKTFLTLLVAVFVASITFSEKIVDVHKSGGWARTAMISCWFLLLVAIVACGTGVSYMVMAYGAAIYQPKVNYRYHENRAFVLFLSSGISFGLGLCTMLLAGLNTFVQSKSTFQAPPGVVFDSTQIANRADSRESAPSAHTP